MVVELNQVTIWDANLPLSTNDFFKKFVSYTITFLINFFIGYNQVKLPKKSRNLIAFMTPLGLIQITTLVQGAINLIVQFVKIVLKSYQHIYETKLSLF